MRPRTALITTAALLALAGCGGGHPAKPAYALSCQQEANKVQALLERAIKDGVAGKQLAQAADEQAAKAFFDQMHKRHCPASSYAQLSRFLNELPG
jgi:hypothetical protein